MKKQLTAAVLCAAMALSMVACGKADIVETTEETEGVSTNLGSFEYKPLPTAEEANVVLGDFDNLTINLVGDYEVSTEVVNELAGNVMASYGLSNMPVDDHDVIVDGDLVMVDYTGYLNGEAFQGGAATDQFLDVTNNCSVDGTGFIDGFTAGLLGQKVGDTIRYEVPFPENYGNADLAGQMSEFEFVIKGIYATRTVDDLTDELVAENFGENFGVSTKADFLEYIKAYIVSGATYDYVQAYVAENCSCTVPDGYLDYVVDNYIQYLAVTNFGSMEALQETYEASGYTVADLKSGLRENLATEIANQIIFSAIAEKLGVTVSEEEENEMLSNYLVENGGSYATVEDVLLEMGIGNLEFGKEYAHVACLTSKVITEIVANSTVMDAEGNILTK